MVKHYLTFLMTLLAFAMGVKAQETEALEVELSSTWASNIVRIDKQVTFRAKSNVAADLKITVNDQEIASESAATFAEGKFTFTTQGDYKVTATATANGQTVSSSDIYCVPGTSQPAASQTVPPMGAFRNADGTVTFCLAAPEKETVILVGSWNDYAVSMNSVMDYVDGPADGEGSFRYFTKTVSGIPVNEPVFYYYMVNNGASYKSVGDPYARLVLDPNNDKWISADVYPNIPEYPSDKVKNVCLAVFQDNFGEYDWKVKDFKGVDKDNLVIYELLFRDFTGTEGKALGNGTVRQAIEKIPYLVELGINAVELLPINEFDGNNSWGYNPNFYFAIDKAYGTAQDYKEFIDVCHQNGIAVILDVVFNQSAGLHPWYQMYSAKENPFYNQVAPHAYSVLNDWKQEYPLVQQQWHDMLKYWLSEYKVDGFRFDLVKGLGNNDSYKNSSEAATNAFNQSRVDRMARLHEAMREVNPDAYFINELLGDAKEENEMAKDGELNWMNVNDPGCEFAMGWLSKSNLNSMWATKAGRTAGSTVAYLESHDEQRLAYKQNEWGAEGVKGDADVSCRRLSSAAAQMLMVPGSHMIWMFSEMGNAQSTKKANGENNTDPKIVDWALMDQPANAELLKRYQELIHLRTEHSVLFSEAATFALSFSGTGMRYATSKYGDAEFYLFVNGALEEKSIEKKLASTDASNYEIVSQSQGPDPVIDYANNKVTLAGGAYVVIMNKTALSGVEDVALDSNALSISVADGRLVVAGAQAPVDVWSVAGMKVAASNGDLDVTLPEGMYIVRSGSKTVKVLVK
ncbi:MAG: hypothetical protein K2M39_08720 [Muribaculaceae bacterium]|nr:hypothetical protein [Muribaculaceae bacterium]